MGLKIFCFFILSIFACSKVNQWKQPTEVCFNINIVEEAIMDGTLLFKEGYISVASFEFDGKRQEGGDVYFTKNYAQELNALFGASDISDLKFDVPQGIYTAVNLEITSAIKEEKPNLVVDGFFKNKQGTFYPIRFELSKMETFSIVGTDLVDKEEEIDLVQVTKTKATILLNPAKWFAVLPKSALEQAEKVSIEGINTILINNAVNGLLYKEIVANLGKGTVKAIFVKQS
jgi:hypothetical protein